MVSVPGETALVTMEEKFCSYKRGLSVSSTLANQRNLPFRSFLNAIASRYPVCFSRNAAISYELTDSAHQLRSLTNLLKRLRFLIVILDFAQMNLFIVRVGVKIWNSIPPSIKLFSRTKYRKVIKSLLEDLLQSEDDYAEVPRLIELFYSLSSLPSYLFSSVIMIF